MQAPVRDVYTSSGHAAYVVDIFVQYSGFRDMWQRYRWLLFALGTVFAAIITRFIAAGMFGEG